MHPQAKRDHAPARHLSTLCELAASFSATGILLSPFTPIAWKTGLPGLICYLLFEISCDHLLLVSVRKLVVTYFVFYQ